MYQKLDNEVSCRSCEQGKLQAEVGQAFCNICPAGYFNDEEGQFFCSSCTGGSFSGGASTVCSSCYPGRASNSGANECEACNEGDYCPAGTSLDSMQTVQGSMTMNGMTKEQFEAEAKEKFIAALALELGVPASAIDLEVHEGRRLSLARRLFELTITYTIRIPVTPAPTPAPTKAPSTAPTNAPTDTPTDEPTETPTDGPTAVPSNVGDTIAPTNVPTYVPTGSPTTPSNAPTKSPTKAPTQAPTAAPTNQPTVEITLLLGDLVRQAISVVVSSLESAEIFGNEVVMEVSNTTSTEIAEAVSGCAPGKYASGGECLDCQMGRYQLLEGRPSCDECEPGRFQPLSGAQNCLNCLSGQFQPETGSTFCLKCRQRAVTRSDGASADKQCLCQESYFHCDLETTECKSDECNICPDGATCIVGTSLESLQGNNNQWRATNETTVFHECPKPDVCVGGRIENGDRDKQCAIGYTGLRCQLCDTANSYATHQPGDICAKCGPTEGRDSLYLAIASAVFAILGLLALWKLKLPQWITATKYVVVTHGQHNTKKGTLVVDKARKYALNNALKDDSKKPHAPSSAFEMYSKRTDGGDGEEMSRTELREQWTSLSTGEKQVHEQLSEDDQQRYDHQRKSYERKVSILSEVYHVRLSEGVDQPEKPSSGRMIFERVVGSKEKKDASTWGSLSTSERGEYQRQAELDKSRFEKELASNKRELLVLIKGHDLMLREFDLQGEYERRVTKIKITVQFIQIALRLSSSYRFPLPAIANKLLDSIKFLEIFDIAQVPMNLDCWHSFSYIQKVYLHTITVAVIMAALKPVAATNLALLPLALVKSLFTRAWRWLSHYSFTVTPTNLVDGALIISPSECAKIKNGDSISFVQGKLPTSVGKTTRRDVIKHMQGFVVKDRDSTDTIRIAATLGDALVGTAAYTLELKQHGFNCETPTLQLRITGRNKIGQSVVQYGRTSRGRSKMVAICSTVSEGAKNKRGMLSRMGRPTKTRIYPLAETHASVVDERIDLSSSSVVDVAASEAVWAKQMTSDAAQKIQTLARAHARNPLRLRQRMKTKANILALRSELIRYVCAAKHLTTEDFFLLFSYSVYTALSDTCFLFYDCRLFEDGETYLVPDPSVKCTDIDYIATIPYVTACALLFPVGIPFYYMYQLWLAKDLVNPAVRNILKDTNYVRSFALAGVHFTEDGKKQTGKRLARAQEEALAKWIKENPKMYTSLAEKDYEFQYEVKRKQAGSKAAKGWIKRKARLANIPARRFKFLWAAYRPAAYWFESFDMFRRFLVTGLPKVLSSMGIHSVQIYIGLAVLTLCPVIYSTVKPYEDHNDHHLMIFTQMAQSTVMLCGMIRENVSGNTSNWIVTAIIMLVLVPMFTMLLFYIYDPSGKMVRQLFTPDSIERTYLEVKRYLEELTAHDKKIRKAVDFAIAAIEDGEFDDIDGVMEIAPKMFASIITLDIDGLTDSVTELLSVFGLGQHQIDQFLVELGTRVVVLCIRRKLQPFLRKQGLEWKDVRPLLECIDSVEELQQVFHDPKAFLRQAAKASAPLAKKLAIMQLKPLLMEQLPVRGLDPKAFLQQAAKASAPLGKKLSSTGY
jgi:hypothetical protein